MKIPVVKEILSANDQVAAENRAAFDAADVFVLNLMASPGAGKTSLILSTVDQLPKDVHPGVIEGDLASTIDADTIAARGIPVVQINTGGNCHLDAPMIRSALPNLPMDKMNLLFIENVGNLVCTANFALGADLAVVVASVFVLKYVLGRPFETPQHETVIYLALAAVAVGWLADVVRFTFAARRETARRRTSGPPARAARSPGSAAIARGRRSSASCPASSVPPINPGRMK